MKYLLVFIAVFSFATISYGQSELRFDIISVDEGLSSSVINSILQDSQGYLWIATRDGLNKYNGVEVEVIRFSPNNNIITGIVQSHTGNFWVGVTGLGLIDFNPEIDEFSIYSYNADDPYSIRDNNVTFIHEDKTGNVWVSTQLKGIEKLDAKTGRFETFLNDEITGYNITYFHEDEAGNIWIGTDQGALLQYVPELNDFRKIYLSDHQNETITSIYPTSSEILIGTNKGLYAYEAETEKITLFNLGSEPRITTIWKDRNNEYWAANGFAVQKLDLENRSSSFSFLMKNHQVVPKYMDKNSWNFIGDKIYLTSQNESPVIVDRNNRFWMITSVGLDVFNPENSNLKEIRIEDSFTNFSRSQITCNYIDDAGSLWFGTVGGGINKYVESRFKHYQYKRDVPYALANHSALSFYETHPTKIWVGNNGGAFSLFDKENETFKRFKIPGSNSVTFDLIEENPQKLLLASAGNGLVQFNPKNSRFIFYQNDENDPKSINSNQVQRILPAGNNLYWVGTSKGLNLFNSKTGNFKKVPLKIPTGDQPNIFELRKKGDVLWIGTIGMGVLGFNLNDSSLQKTFNSITLEDNSLNDYITSILVDENGIIWAGTYGGGIIRINTEENTHQVISGRNGLPNKVIYYITDDKNGFLWATSNAGLVKIDKNSLQVIDQFDIYDGLQSNEFNRGSGLKLKSGEILIGGINGVNLFDPLVVKKESYLPKTVLTAFKIFDEDVTEKLNQIKNGKNEINLTHEQSSITISFATLDYRNPAKNQYKYRLAGLSDNWITTSNLNPRANFTSLDPGSYTFELLSSNSDGIWASIPLKFDIKIEPPFWKTGWFLSMISLTAIALGIYLPLARIRTLDRQKTRLNDVVIKRTQEIQDKNQQLNSKNNELELRTDELIKASEELFITNQQLKKTLKSLQETQGKLVESEKMASLGILSAGIGHELNNPLNFIKGGVDVLFNQLKNDPNANDRDYQELITTINEGVSRASKIVTSLGHFSRTSTQMNEEFQVENIIENCLEILKSIITEKINIVKELNTGSNLLKGNEGRMHQAILNILNNAIQALSGEGEIKISTFLQKSKCIIEISDNGNGIPPEYIDKVMDPFFTTKDPGKGTGLGLSITYNIIQEHGGDITIDSELNEGTKIRIVLPVVKG